MNVANSHGKLARLRRGGLFALTAVLVLAGLAPAPVVVGNARWAAGGDTPDEDRPLPLVHADEQLAGFLKGAGELIDEGRYQPAIEILQALIARPDAGFVGTEDPRLFTAMSVRAAEMIGRMPPDGLELYRRLYDPQAQRLYAEADAAGDPAALRRVAVRYLHTTWGPRALERLAELHFDRGRFAQAARTWRRLDEMPGVETDAMLLAKLAVAGRLAGEDEAARAAADRLARDFPEAVARIGGRERKIAAWARSMLDAPLPEFAARRPSHTDWPGVAGDPDGIVRMPDPTQVVLAPRWTGGASDRMGDVKDAVVAQRSLLSGPANHRNFGMSIRLRRGLVEMKVRYSNQKREATLLPVIEPVVMDGRCIYRTDEEVLARDVATGRLRWRTEGLPVERSVQGVGARYHYYPGINMPFGDLGRHRLSSGGGLVYALYGFLPGGINLQNVLRQRPEAAAQLADSSALAAIDPVTGKLAWMVGNGRGEEEIVTSGKFLSVPTYYQGELFVPVEHLETIYVVCLSAADGRLRWKSAVSQSAGVSQPYTTLVGSLLDRTSSPAVVDGRVYFVTDSGVAACLDADSGRAVWAYQYESDVTQLAGRRIHPSHLQNAGVEPINPTIVAGGRVICLPTDSDAVLALSTEDGSLLWSRPRERADHLAGIDEQRVCLAGRGVSIVDIRTGETIEHVAGLDVQARPAVTDSYLVLTTPGRISRVDLSSGAVSAVDLSSPEGLLGNLVCVEDKIFAANTLGVSAYFRYDSVYEELTGRIADAAPDEKPSTLYERALLAFNARRFEQALEDLDAVREAPGGSNDNALALKADRLTYRTLVALGNVVDDPEKTIERFRQAREYARTDQEAGHMLLRLAKAHERAGRYAEAAALAQQLAETYPDEPLVDVRVGDKANLYVRFYKDTPTVEGRKLALDYIRRLIELHGREVYAAFDARAAERLEAVRPAADPEKLIAVAERWPLSESADEARFAAAEAYYRRAGAAEGDKARELLRRAERELGALAHDREADLWASANVALAMIHVRAELPAVARLDLATLRDTPPGTKVSFADLGGTLGELRERILAGDVPAPSLPTTRPARAPIGAPLEPVLTVGGEGAYLLRDPDLSPVYVGDDSILAFAGNEVLRVRMTADDAESAVIWRAELGVKPDELAKHVRLQPTYGLFGAFDAASGRVVVSDTQELLGLDAETGDVVWRHKLVKLAPHGQPQTLIATTGGGACVLASRNGPMVCVNMGDGEVRWRSQLNNRQRQMFEPGEIASGVLLMRAYGYKALLCFDMAGGKLLGEWSASHRISGRIRSGLLIMLSDATLSVRPCKGGAQPLWTHTYTNDDEHLNDAQFAMMTSVLDARGDLVAVSPGDDPTGVELRSIRGGGAVVARAEARLGDDEDGGVMDAAVSDGAVYLFCSTGNRPNAALRDRRGYPAMTQGVSVQRYDVRSDRLDWAADLATGRNGHCAFVRPVRVADRLAFGVFAWSGMPGGAERRLFVIDDETGKVLDRIVTDTEQRSPIPIATSGPPAVAGGRVCVETDKGLVIHEGK